MSKFWETKDFKKLNQEWKEKLSADGFEDIEDHKSRLKQQNRRTIAFENRDRIRDFFSDLNYYVTHARDIPLLHQRILQLFGEGVRVQGKDGIVEKVGRSDAVVRKIIRKYKKIVLTSVD